MKSILFCLSLLFTVGFSFGQWELEYRNLSTEDGLPTNTIYDFKQAENGLILIGHNKGLTSYDGNQFRNYTSDKITPLGNIIEFKPNLFLCRNFNDECFLTNNKNYLIKHEKLSTNSNHFSNYIKLKNGNVIRQSYNKIEYVFINGKFGIKELFKTPTKSSINSTVFLNNRIYIHHSSQISCLDMNTKEAIYELSSEESPRSILISFNKSVFLFKTTLGEVIQIEENKQNTLKLPSYEASELYTSHTTIGDSVLAIGTYGGIYLYDKNLKFLGKYLKFTQVSALMNDIEGNLWVGTLQDGVFIIPSITIKTHELKNTNEKPFKISKAKIIRDSLIVLGSFNGKLIILDKDANQKSIVDLNVKGHVQSIYFDEKSKTLLVDCNGLHFIDLNNKKIVKTINLGSGKDVLIQNNITYVASSNGLYGLGKSFEHYHNKLWVKKIVPFFDNLLLETNNGVLIFNTISKTIAEPNWKNYSVDNNLITSVTTYNEKTYFIEEGVVYKVLSENLELKKVISFENKKIHLLAVNEEYIMASDGNRIYFSDKKNKLVTIDEYDGLSIKEVNQISFFKNKILAIGADKIQLIPFSEKKKNVLPNLICTSFSGTFKMENGLLTSDFSNNKLHLTLNVLPNITARGNAVVYYKIPTIINHWDVISKESGYSLKLDRLPFGKYKLHLIAMNHNKKLSKPLTVDFIIKKPFYYTWWFISINTIVLLVLLYLIIVWRTHYITKKNQAELEKEKLKISLLQSELKALRSQMNPHFIFNTLTSIQSDILNKDTKKAYDYLSSFSSLLRQALNHSSKELISLEDEINFIKLYVKLEQHRFSNKFNFEINIEENISISKIKFPSLISQPILENAIKHAFKENKVYLLKYIIRKHNNNLVVSIEDNGIGITKSKLENQKNKLHHQSYATSAINERIDMLNKTEKLNISVQTEQLEQGTRVNIILKDIF